MTRSGQQPKRVPTTIDAIDGAAPMPRPLATVDLDPRARCRLALPFALWSDGLHLGERVIVESAAGEVWPSCEVVLGDGDRPTVRLKVPPDSETTCVTVRRPRVFGRSSDSVANTAQSFVSGCSVIDADDQVSP